MKPKIVILGDNVSDIKKSYNMILSLSASDKYSILNETRINLSPFFVDLYSFFMDDIFELKPKFVIINFNTIDSIKDIKPFYTDHYPIRLQKLNILSERLKRRINGDINNDLIILFRIIEKILEVGIKVIFVYPCKVSKDLIPDSLKKNTISQLIKRQLEHENLFQLKYNEDKLEVYRNIDNIINGGLMEEKRKRVVIVGDSLPKFNRHVPMENGYPNLLQDRIKDRFVVVNNARRSNDTDIQVLKQNLIYDIDCWDPEIVLLHLGINDCSPRIFTKTENLILNRMPGILRRRIISFFSSNRRSISYIRKITYVDIIRFEQNVNTIIDHCKAKGIKIIIISILETNDRIKNRSYGIERNIHRYNGVLEKIARHHNIDFIRINNGDDDLVLEDGIHLTVRGNKVLADKLYEQLNQYE